MSDLALVMPMAGRGSRFSLQGIQAPKPLVNLKGRPFFWWAVESVRRVTPIREMVFVVLDEHCEQFNIHQRIYEFYPQAIIVSIPDITSGAAETAFIGLNALKTQGPVAINDCDHVFYAPGLSEVSNLLCSSADGALLCFHSKSPGFSYLKLSVTGEIIGTIEKQVASPYAIAGCYLFSSPQLFSEIYTEYQNNCHYQELFISGIYNLLAERGKTILKLDAAHHLPFGTPEELALITDDKFQAYDTWTLPV